MAKNISGKIPSVTFTSETAPLSETAFYILLALDKPKSGSGISRFVTKLTKGRIRPGPGTVYSTLVRMQRQRMIIVFDDSGRRIIYDRTDLGRELLSAGTRRITAISRDVQEVFKEGEG